MDWELFKDKFHPSYWRHMKTWVESSNCDELYGFLKKERMRKGEVICPDSDKTFRCFKETSLEDIKCVLLGMSPYHTEKYGIKVADGLLMSCSNHEKYIAPSLEQFYGGLEEEFNKGLCLTCKKGGDLSYLAKQGVLMFNASLTCELRKAGSHLKQWEHFTKLVFENIIAISGVPVVFLGDDAEKFKRYLGPMQWEFKVSHPASASYNHTNWSSEGTFKKVNKIIKDQNGVEIKWLQYVEEELEEAPF